jgi:mannitol/fructose-specific phosphotransferase system IIA component
VTDLIEPPIVEVLPPRAYGSKRAVIEAIGGVMIGAGAVTRAYVDGMLRKELEASTLVTADVALPHGTADVRSGVLRNVLVIAPISGGVEWVPDTPVRLAIGFAGTGDEAHLRLLGSVARVLADDGLLERLKAGGDTRRLAALFV